MAKIFGHNVINSVAMEEAGLLWLYENQWRYWARLGEQPPQAPGIPPGMRVLDFEVSVRECSLFLVASP